MNGEVHGGSWQSRMHVWLCNCYMEWVLIGLLCELVEFCASVDEIFVSFMDGARAFACVNCCSISRMASWFF